METAQRETKLTNVERTEEKPMLTREELFGRSKIKEIRFYSAAFGRDVLIKPLSYNEYEELSKRAKESDGSLNIAKFNVLTLIHGLVDPKLDQKDAGVLLSQTNGKYLREIAQEIWNISGLGDVEAKKNV